MNLQAQGADDHVDLVNQIGGLREMSMTTCTPSHTQSSSPTTAQQGLPQGSFQEDQLPQNTQVHGSSMRDPYSSAKLLRQRVLHSGYAQRPPWRHCRHLWWKGK